MAAKKTPPAESGAGAVKKSVASAEFCVLRISSRPESWRRCGRIWTREPQDVPASDFTDEEIDLLKGERMLCVEELAGPLSEEAGGEVQ